MLHGTSATNLIDQITFRDYMHIQLLIHWKREKNSLSNKEKLVTSWSVILYYSTDLKMCEVNKNK